MDQLLAVDSNLSSDPFVIIVWVIKFRGTVKTIYRKSVFFPRVLCKKTRDAGGVKKSICFPRSNISF